MMVVAANNRAQMVHRYLPTAEVRDLVSVSTGMVYDVDRISLTMFNAWATLCDNSSQSRL